MKLANINSKKPYYVTKEGLIFNSDFNLVVGGIDKKYNLKVFNYKDIDGVTRKTTFTKVIFSTFYPEIPLEGCTIVRIGDKNDYSLSNLKCINNKKMPKYIGIDKGNINNLKTVGVSFYEKLTLLQQNTFIGFLKSKKYTDKFLASKYGVSEMAIYRAKVKLGILTH